MHGFHCGNSVIDAGHEKLEQKSQALAQLWKERPAQTDVLMRALADFRFTLTEHFCEEETICRGAGLADAERHHQAHQRLLARFDALRGLASTGAAPDFASSFDRILSDHEFIEDAMFLTSLTSHDLKEGQALLRWDDDLRVGDLGVDMQHQKLTHHVNQLYAAAEAGDPQGELSQLMESFVLAVELHFSEEELLLADAPGEARRHAQQHRVLLEDLRRRQFSVATPREIAIFCRDYLRYWLMDHINRCDRPDFAMVAAKRAVQRSGGFFGEMSGTSAAHPLSRGAANAYLAKSW